MSDGRICRASARSIVTAIFIQLPTKTFSFAFDHEINSDISSIAIIMQSITRIAIIMISITLYSISITSVIKDMSHLVALGFKIEQVVCGSVHLYRYTLLYFQSEAAETVDLVGIVGEKSQSLAA